MRRVVIADSQYCVRAYVKQLLDQRTDITVLASAASVSELTTALATHRPEIVISSRYLPRHEGWGQGSRMNVAQSWPSLREHAPEARLLVLTSAAHIPHVENRLADGVGGFIVAGDNLSTRLPIAIHSVAMGGLFLSERIGRRLLQPEAPAPNRLTRRQAQVLSAIAASPNETYASHARRLGISESTFKAHLTRVFNILQVENVTAAVVAGLARGYVPLEIVFE